MQTKIFGPEIFVIKFLNFSDIKKPNVLSSIKQKIKNYFKKVHFIVYYTTTPIKIDIKFCFEYSVHYINSLFRPRRREEYREKTINTDKTFKSDECVICLTNPPNVLFRNCGHQCICINCNKKKSLVKCPVCKAETRLKEL